MEFNKESFEKALKANKIIRYQKHFEAVVKSYLEAETEQCNIANVGGSLLFDVVKKLEDGNYMISLIDGKENYATYADNMPELFERLAEAFRAMEDVEQ